MGSTIYIEGGGDSKELHVRCRNGFRKLFEKCGYVGKMPRLVSCGGRASTFDDFKVAHAAKTSNDFVAMLIDSEEPLQDINGCWKHLWTRDGWAKPDAVTEEQVLFMTTCMETWIVADRKSLKSHYGSQLIESRLPPAFDLEKRPRHEVQKALELATENCSNAYRKGKRSFEALAAINSDELKRLPSFSRITGILDESL
jgi:hypothetical protein